MDRVFSAEELAERYKTSPETIRNWRYKGTGPRYFKAGKRILYREFDVISWEKDQVAAIDAAKAC